MLNMAEYASYNGGSSTASGDKHGNFNGSFSANARIGADRADISQQNIQNMHFADHTLSHFYVPTAGPSRVNFASESGLMASGNAMGNGLGAAEVEAETDLYWRTKAVRDVGKLNLNPRTYVTVPYLGRGSCDTENETRMLRGEVLVDKRTGRAASSMAALRQPDDCPVPDRPREKIDEDALRLDGWTRGGLPTRAANTDSK